MEARVDALLETVRHSVVFTVAHYLTNAIDPVNLRMLAHTHFLPSGVDRMVTRALDTTPIPDGLDIDAWNDMCHIIEHGIPVGLLCMSHEFETGNVYNMVERAMNACMLRIRAGYIHEDMVQSLVEHQDKAARLIQTRFRFVIASPKHLMCRQRLLREFNVETQDLKLHVGPSR
jgi:hypothetical protein